MTIEEISQALAHLAAELHQINATLKAAAPLVAPVTPPRPAGPNAGGAANHLAQLLAGNSHVVIPHEPPTPILPPEVMARYTADQKAYVDAFRSLGPMGAFHMHLQPPNLNNYKNDHGYVWPGHVLIASYPSGHNPTAL